MLDAIMNFLDSLDEKLGFHRAKRFEFVLGGKPAALEKERWTGRLTLVVNDEVFELRRRNRVIPPPMFKRWAFRIDGHDVVVEYRIRSFLSPVVYRVTVDGRTVAQADL